jgi:SHS2 domain-containing protein
MLHFDSDLIAFVIRIRHCHMPYEYLEEIGTADIAFEATGRDLPELFQRRCGRDDERDDRQHRGDSAARDTPDRALERQARHVAVRSLQELIFLKDAERLLLRIARSANRRERREIIF